MLKNEFEFECEEALPILVMTLCSSGLQLSAIASGRRLQSHEGLVLCLGH